MGEVEERLREWSFYFRDAPTRHRSGSIESLYRSPQCWYPIEPKPAYSRPRAERTHIAMSRVSLPSKWALTYSYCWPWMPHWMVLKGMRHRLGKRISGRDFEDLVYFGKIHLNRLLVLDKSEESSRIRVVGHSPIGHNSCERQVFP